MHIKRYIYSILAWALTPMAAVGAEVGDSAARGLSFYIPEVHGVARARYEVDTDNGEGRFQIRNARVNLSGRVLPRLRYYLNTDFCDKGSVKVLDVWARIDIGSRWFVQAGQFRIPFGTDNFRGPGTYYFANRSYLGKYVNNVRAVGIKGRYTLPWGSANYIEAGMFNSATISDHDVWSKDYAYAVKVSQQAADWLRFETGFESIEPGSVRMNLWGASAIVTVARCVPKPSTCAPSTPTMPTPRPTSSTSLPIGTYPPRSVSSTAGVSKGASMQSPHIPTARVSMSRGVSKPPCPRNSA